MRGRRGLVRVEERVQGAVDAQLRDDCGSFVCLYDHAQKLHNIWVALRRGDTESEVHDSVTVGTND